MKNIFAFDTTENSENIAFDGARYITARVDGWQERALDSAREALAKAAEQGKLPKGLRILKSIAGWAAALYLCVLLNLLEDVSLRELFSYAPICSLVLVVSFLLWLALWLAARRRARRTPQSAAFQAAAAAHARLMAQSLAQMGAPDDAPKIDILMYSYKVKRGRELPNGPYMNCESTIFLEDDCLCITDGFVKVSLPLGSMTGLRRVNRRLCVMFWNKDTPYNKGIYKKYRITVNSAGVIFFKPHYILTLEEYSETFQWYIAPYDIEAVQQVLSQGFGGTFSLPVQ